MASATFLSTLVFSAMASMICDFVNAIMFSSFSIPCQGRTTRTPPHYKKWPLEGKKNKTADEGLESGSKTTLCHPHRPRNAQHGSAYNSWDNLLTSEDLDTMPALAYRASVLPRWRVGRSGFRERSSWRSIDQHCLMGLQIFL